MKKRTFLIFMSAVFAVLMAAAIPAGLPLGAVAMAAAAPPLAGIEGPGGVPHYFGPYGNWAYSPLPKGNLNTALTVDSGGSGYTAPVITITDAYDSTLSGTASATVVSGAITAIALTSASAGFSAPVVTITDPTGTGAAATATLNISTLTGGLRKFVDKMPLLGPTGANNIIQAHGAGQYIPVAVPETVTFSGQPADYYEIALVEFTEKMHSDLPPTRLRGYVQLSTTAVPGSSIALKQIDGLTPILKPDGSPAIAVDNPHYLGPLIVAKGRAHGVAGAPGQPVPVRIKFYNLLPTGAGGDLFIPVDGTVMGAGLGPGGLGAVDEEYKQNRATIHLHGNNTVWISDGNVHQWITPANESTPYPKGASVYNVPDMPDPGPGAMTFFYTNAQGARLQFYHDHAMGITRLNVYGGEAAGYVITDAVEQDMINGTNFSGVNINPNGTDCPLNSTTCAKVLPDIGIPLVIQDKTWVDANTIFAQDPTWNWGTGPRDPNTGNITGAVTGDLWYPHVYMSAQNPWDLTGTNAVGRWHYGPWFNPPVPSCVAGLPVGCIEVGPVPNEYYDPINAPWEPPMRPGVPNPSMPGEGFMDTPLVNGTPYPYLEVEPKAYRFRVLSACQRPDV